MARYYSWRAVNEMHLAAVYFAPQIVCYSPGRVVHVYACTYYPHTRCVHVREAPSDQLARIQGFPRPSSPRRDGDSVRVSPAYPWVRLSFLLPARSALRLREHGSLRFIDFLRGALRRWPQNWSKLDQFVTSVWKFWNRHKTATYLFKNFLNDFRIKV